MEICAFASRHSHFYAYHYRWSPTPGILLHDQQALAVDDRLWQFSGWWKWLGLWRLPDVFRPDFQEVVVVASSAYYGAQRRLNECGGAIPG